MDEQAHQAAFQPGATPIAFMGTHSWPTKPMPLGISGSSHLMKDLNAADGQPSIIYSRHLLLDVRDALKPRDLTCSPLSCVSSCAFLNTLYCAVQNDTHLQPKAYGGEKCHTRARHCCRICLAMLYLSNSLLDPQDWFR